MTSISADHTENSDRHLLAAMAFCWADILLEIDENGYILFAAGASDSLLGCPPDRLVGEALERLALREERPLLRAYLHVGPGIKRLEELDISLRLPDTSEQESPCPVIPVSLSGYLISDRITRYYLAVRHRAIRPRARSGIDCMVLQHTLVAADQNNFITRRRHLPDQSAKHTVDTIPLTHNEALIVLENLAASRSKAETDAAGELAGLIRMRGRETTTLSLTGGNRAMHEPMIDLERRIVAYASALRADLDDPTLSDTNPHQTIAGTQKHSEDRQIFAGQDYDIARAVHHLPDIAGNGTETNLTRAVAYALNRLQANDESDVTAERLSASMPRLIQETLKSVRAFREIIQSGSFGVALQPIVDLNTQQMHHYEALARFNDPTGNLAVDQIIHFAEGTGLITDFDLAMCGKILAFLESPHNQSDYQIAVNLSGHSLEQPEFITALEALLDQHAIAPNSLLFEVTETARIISLPDVNAILQRLRRRGHLVCLDDFGAGAANFEYLSALDVDIIKFDGKAMQTALANQKGRAFIRATALLCRELNISTIAEMIHDDATFETIRDLGIEFGQGYHFGHPQTIAASLDGATSGAKS
ncbi:EAL domain-containing protein [Thalassospira sp.]|uniref:sensor domain-containing phosphodiesterase n=1 Tax=Thalassospira sp. TaxID=1912094 RepID=UPI0027332472|nr:EAL domain-containing protein [Thalassospira sp.]MDP2698165.1 EAL domain-containing protein [Thalassospira sp.]